MGPKSLRNVAGNNAASASANYTGMSKTIGQLTDRISLLEHRYSKVMVHQTYFKILDEWIQCMFGAVLFPKTQDIEKFDDASLDEDTDNPFYELHMLLQRVNFIEDELQAMGIDVPDLVPKKKQVPMASNKPPLKRSYGPSVIRRRSLITSAAKPPPPRPPILKPIKPSANVSTSTPAGVVVGGSKKETKKDEVALSTSTSSIENNGGGNNKDNKKDDASTTTTVTDGENGGGEKSAAATGPTEGSGSSNNGKPSTSTGGGDDDDKDNKPPILEEQIKNEPEDEEDDDGDFDPDMEVAPPTPEDNGKSGPSSASEDAEENPDIKMEIDDEVVDEEDEDYDEKVDIDDIEYAVGRYAEKKIRETVGKRKHGGGNTSYIEEEAPPQVTYTTRGRRHTLPRRYAEFTGHDNVASILKSQQRASGSNTGKVRKTAVDKPKTPSKPRPPPKASTPKKADGSRPECVYQLIADVQGKEVDELGNITLWDPIPSVRVNQQQLISVIFRSNGMATRLTRKLTTLVFEDQVLANTSPFGTKYYSERLPPEPLEAMVEFICNSGFDADHTKKKIYMVVGQVCNEARAGRVRKLVPTAPISTTSASGSLAGDDLPPDASLPIIPSTSTTPVPPPLPEEAVMVVPSSDPPVV